jgi:hypothetical protein
MEPDYRLKTLLKPPTKDCIDTWKAIAKPLLWATVKCLIGLAWSIPLGFWWRVRRVSTPTQTAA